MLAISWYAKDGKGGKKIVNFFTNLDDAILTSTRNSWDKSSKTMKLQRVPTITNVYNNNHNFWMLVQL